MNLVPDPPRLRLDPESYEALRQQVLRRDGWRCQEFGTVSNLKVHHKRFPQPLWPRLRDEPDHPLLHCHASTHGQTDSSFAGEGPQPDVPHQNCRKMSAIRSPVRPSHRGGVIPSFCLPSNMFLNSTANRPLSSPTKMFVPAVTVIGRSVLDLKVKHGTRK